MAIRVWSGRLMVGSCAFVALTSAARAQPHTVTFVLDLRPEIEARRFDPARDGVGVRGGTLPLSWKTTLPAADPDGDGRYGDVDVPLR